VNETFERPLSRPAQDVNWLLDSFVAGTPGVEQALGVSSDGLLMAVSARLSRAEADRLAAMISGMISLSLSASRLLSKGPLRQVITEFGQGFLMVSAISGGSSLGVITAAGCDLGTVGYESAVLVQRIGQLLTPQLIAELKLSLDL
jgi:predicted regulator of Ras-like GTPase activity (Roadblock/LC7/MglB family)